MTSASRAAPPLAWTPVETRPMRVGPLAALPGPDRPGVSLRRLDGVPFSISSIDLAATSLPGSGLEMVTFSGALAGGPFLGYVSQTCPSIDGRLTDLHVPAGGRRHHGVEHLPAEFRLLRPGHERGRWPHRAGRPSCRSRGRGRCSA